MRARFAHGVGFALAAGLVLSAGPGVAQAANPEQGQWDLARVDKDRKCRLTLRAGAGDGEGVAVMPAGCRRALPVLAAAKGWRAPGDVLVITDAGGKDVLRFTPTADGPLAATGPDGENYTLTALGAHQLERLTAAAPPAPAPEARVPGFQVARPGQPRVAQAAPAAPKPSGEPVRAADVPGRYAILREQTKDTGCMLTLEEKAAGPKGSRKALLAPACRDQGMVIFDPTGWKLEGSRLVLYARKGHTTHLDKQADGNWLKDPKEGKSLSLRKI